VPERIKLRCMIPRGIGVSREKKFLGGVISYSNVTDLSFVEGEDAAVIGGGNSALQIVENLHTVARKINLISTSELSADVVLAERMACIPNVQTYIDYKVVRFMSDGILAEVTIRKLVGDATRTCRLKVLSSPWVWSPTLLYRSMGESQCAAGDQAPSLLLNLVSRNFCGRGPNYRLC
jgi:hypothetical protein